MRHVAVDVDVAVAVGSLAAGEGVGEQRAPHLGPDEAVDVQVMRVLEHHHRAADDLVPLPRSPERTQLVWRVLVAPVESSRRRLGGGGELASSGRRHRIGRAPGKREVARLREKLLETQDRPVTHVPLERSDVASADRLCKPHAFGELDGEMNAQGVPEAIGPEAQGVGVEQVPAAGDCRGESRQARPEDRPHRTGEGERDRAVGSQSHARGGLDERLRPVPGREPAQPGRLRDPLPDARHGADRHASRSLPCLHDAEIDRRARSGETQRPCVAAHPQGNRPHGRVERRDQRLARTDLEPAATEACARRAYREPRLCRTADQPARPAGTANLELDGQLLTRGESLLGPQSPVPDGDRDDPAVGSPDHDTRDTPRVARLHDVGKRLGVRLDPRLRPPQQSDPGCDGTGRERQPEEPEGRPRPRASPPAPDRFEHHASCIARAREERSGDEMGALGIEPRPAD